MKYFILFLYYCQFVNAYVSLTFDDGLDEHYTIANELNVYDMKATFYVNSGRLGNNRLTINQLKQMQQLGHEIGGHTINHVNLNTTSLDSRTQEVCNDKQNLENMGLQISSFAYPFGITPTKIEDIIQSCGYTSARDSGGLQLPNSCNGCPYALSLPAEEPFHLRSISYRKDMTLFDLQQNMRRKNSGDWIIFVFHEITNSNGSITSINMDLLIEFIKWLKDEDIPIRTVNQVVSGDLLKTTEPPTEHPTTILNIEQTTQPPYLIEKNSMDLLLIGTIVVMSIFIVLLSGYLGIQLYKYKKVKRIVQVSDIENQFEKTAIDISQK